jgi:hypothetical protein
MPALSHIARWPVIALVGIAGLCVCSCDKAPPGNGATTTPQRRLVDKPTQPDADAPLVESFKSHRAAFDELKSMILADAGIGEVNLTSASDSAGNGLSKQRLDAYIDKLKAAGATSVATRGPHLDKGDVSFQVPTPPNWPAGSHATILFATATGLQRVDLIAPVLVKAQGIRAARELDINWYLVGEN